MARRHRRGSRERERLEELLSAYLDGQVADSERTELERLLAEDPALRVELEALRHTVRLLREMPQLDVPRNFILPRSVAAPARGAESPRRRLLAPLLTGATSLATLLFGIVLAGEIVLSGAGGPVMLSAPAEPEQTEIPAAAPTADEEALGAAPAPAASEPAATKAPSEDGDGVDTVEGQFLAPTASPEPGRGGGGTGVPDSEPAALPTATPISPPTALPTTAPAEEREPAIATPTPARIGEANGERDTEWADEEQAEHVVAYESAAERVAPLWLWRVVEIGLGLGVVILCGATVWAWRARRRGA
jgi:hypothetical protein